jgi:hypothetical protein
VPLLGDLSLLLVGDGRSGRPSSGVETRHNPRRAPPLKEFAKPSGGDSLTGRHLPDSFVGGPLALGLTDEPLDASVGRPGHGKGGGGPDSAPPPGPPPTIPASTAGQVLAPVAPARN